MLDTRRISARTRKRSLHNMTHPNLSNLTYKLFCSEFPTPMEPTEVSELIKQLIRNEQPDLKPLLARLRPGERGQAELIHSIVSEFTNLRSYSDRPLRVEQFQQFVELSLAVFDVYVAFCERLVREKHERAA